MEDWEAQADVRTMAQADEIRNDPERYNRAKAAAVQLAKDARSQAASLSKIANQEMFSKSAKDLGIHESKSTTD
jgi:hypothetical protein